MAITNYRELIQSVADWADVTDTESMSRIRDAIALAETRFQRTIQNIEQETRYYVSTNEQWVDLPTGFRSFVSLTITANGKTTPLKHISVSQGEHDEQTPGIPTSYSIIGNQLRLCPAPNSLIRLDAVYVEKFVPLDDTNSSNWLLLNHPDIYLSASLVEQFTFLFDEERAQLWSQKLQNQMEELDWADRRKKWFTGIPLQQRHDSF